MFHRQGLGGARLACVVLSMLVCAAPFASAAGAAVAGEPVVAYFTETEAVVADAQGQEIRRYPNFLKMSLGGDVLAGELPGKEGGTARIVGYEAATGERLFRIRDARLPVVVDGGRKLAFFPTFERDRYGLSVWMRTAAGRLREVARFATKGRPGIRHGMRAGASPLDIALDGTGRKMAIVAGLEDLRSFDVWVVDVKTKEATRLTRGENSHNPSLSPGGTQLAVRVESPDACPDPLYGQILIGKIRVFSLATGLGSTLTEFSCDVFYDTPRWIDEQTLVAVRVTKDGAEELGYDLDVVKIDAATGAITEVVTEGNPCCITASPDLGKIAYGFSDRDGFAIFDLVSGITTDFTGQVYVPHLSGESRF